MLILASEELSVVTVNTYRAIREVQSNFKGSNTFGTMKISLRQGWFKPMWVDNSAWSGGIIRISLIFYNMKVSCVLIRIASLRRFK